MDEVTARSLLAYEPDEICTSLSSFLVLTQRSQNKQEPWQGEMKRNQKRWLAVMLTWPAIQMACSCIKASAACVHMVSGLKLLWLN